MTKKNRKKPVALVLALTLAFGGTIADADRSSAMTDKTLVLADTTAASGSAASRSSVSNDTTGTAIVTGAAVTENLKAIIKRADEKNVSEPIRFQKLELGNSDIQMKAFVAKILFPANKKVKYGLCDINNDGMKELFLFDGKKVDVYEYSEDMANMVATKDGSVGSVGSKEAIDNVIETRVKSKKKATFTVKQKKGKLTSYTTYKFTFEIIKKGVTYSKKGKTYKKNNKKISKKAFNKYVKSYKKLKKIKKLTPYPFDGNMYTSTDFVYFTKDLYEVSTTEEDADFSSHLIVRHDANDKTNPYKAFGEGISNFRVVFGADVEKDYNSFLNTHVSITKICAPLKSIMNGDGEYIVSGYEKQEAAKQGVYYINFNDPESEADFGYSVFVDESGNEPVLTTVQEIDSNGLRNELYYIYKGAEAEIDGEMYTPGLDAEIYADDEYIKATGEKVRTLAIDLAGTKTEAKACADSKFVLYSSTGTFTVPVNGKDVDVSKVKNDSDEYYAIDRVLNPDSGDAGGYGAPQAEVKWVKKA
ncbi:MAG: hypothetical protein J6P16_04265 [Eubacterium sp.]|nr:hypothetical protein [Eubacterium sp.]